MSGAERLGARFDRAKRDGRAAFVAFVSAGDPDLATTGRLLAALGPAGVDVVEIGVPFSDPIADGPVIQRASERALAAGASLAGVLDLAAALSSRPDAPAIVLFSYLNPILRMGTDRFAARAAAAGVDGVLITDLPIDEPEPLVDRLAAAGVATIPLLSPTSAKGRFAAARRRGGGFAYLISRTGVTGAQVSLSGDLAAQVKRARREQPLPVAVGFGISTPEQVAAVARIADGVVVGSALVAAIERAEAGREVEAAVRFLAPMAAATRR